jgi:hypothetical protein
VSKRRVAAHAELIDASQLRATQMATLAEKVRFLSDPSAYPRITKSVEAKETHMSWVFLAEDRVYKLKKPVKYPFLDFSTSSRRRSYCEEEIRLNRRLTGETYLAVIPLRFERVSGLSFSGQGRIVDWLVEMKRLPQVDMLDMRLSEGRVSKEDVLHIGNLMARFGWRICCGTPVYPTCSNSWPAWNLLTVLSVMSGRMSMPRCSHSTGGGTAS